MSYKEGQLVTILYTNHQPFKALVRDVSESRINIQTNKNHITEELFNALTWRRLRREPNIITRGFNETHVIPYTNKISLKEQTHCLSIELRQ